MLECEIKLLDIEKGAVITKLLSLGAVQENEELIIDMYLETPKPKQMRSRIRCTEQSTILTCKYKLPTTTTKQAYEFDTILPHDYEVENDIWSKMVNHVRIKKRITYTRGGYIFDIDQYRGLPPILEIEGPDEASIQKTIQLLGREKYTQAPCGGKGVYAYYQIDYPKVTSKFVGRLLSLIRCL